MNIGFIGAGRVGVTMGRYLLNNKIVSSRHNIIGYCDIDKEAASEAARYTESEVLTIEEIVKKSDIIFITVVDGAIMAVGDYITQYDLKGKIVCHCSGALSSEVFSNIDKQGAYRYSVHPLFACSSKENSYKDISNALFTIEGSVEKLSIVKQLVEDCGNKVTIIKAEDKVKYHAAAVMASNQMIGLLKCATDLLKESGFEDEDALFALKPLIIGNIENALKEATSIDDLILLKEEEFFDFQNAIRDCLGK
jgi:predicted short-subunit dehydrogenase-like oxidoreductase (DUF2520 family)